MSYHRLSIHKHKHTSPFKLQEEVLEYLDAVGSNNKIMAIQELSDIYGCLENEIAKYNLTVSDLKVMSDTTKKVFEKGSRPSFDLYNYLTTNHDNIVQTGLGFIQIKIKEVNYNFYHKDLELYENWDKPHNHQTDFISEVTQGSLSEKLYLVIPNGSEISYCGCGNSDELIMVDSKLVFTNEYKPGQLYVRLKEEYHTVKGSHGTITKVVKYGSKTNAFVVSDLPHKTIKPLTELEMWAIVEEVFKQGVLDNV